MKLLELLRQPDREFSPVPFWFLNGDLTDGELRRQLEDFAAHGVYGVVLHPRIGLPDRIAYLGETFFHYIRTAVETAAELGMQVVLYDEGMYPSGSACGQVVRGHPELASQGLALTRDIRPGDQVLCAASGGTLVVRPSGGTLRGLHWGEDDGEPNAPKSADILNPKAVDRFIQLTHEAYYRAVGTYFGTTVIGFFTDEPSILGRNAEGMMPWTQGFRRIFEEAGGRVENLAALFTGESNADTALYERLLLEREETVYYGSLSRWCEDHGIALMGHPHQSDDIEVERLFHIPGQDLVLRWIAPETGGLDGINATMAKCSADAARLFGRRRNSNECLGACNFDGNPWQLSGGDVKWYLDWLAVRGVNFFIPHAFYYSVQGQRSQERPPDVGPNSLWWPWYDKWSLYMSRLACLMTDARLRTPVAVLCRNRDLKPELVKPLFQHQTGFQYLPESVWSQCRVENGKLLYRDMVFEALVGDSENRFPTVSRHWQGLADCLCDPPMKDLRCAGLQRAGTACWLLVNEGDRDIQTTLTLPTNGPLGQMDLWTGAVSRRESPRLLLPRRGSVLLFACTPAQWAELPASQPETALLLPRFTQTAERPDRLEKQYAAELSFHGEPNPTLTVQGEEMARLTVNGREAGVSFWSPHRFSLEGLLQEGSNRLELTFTGSLANRYGRPVPYGLAEEGRTL
ncbi:MAG: hypothetical protein Q4F17_00710 [Eubacteriales bacterium]|nr:hypothetical protein [Eubacteriales bacterium]